MKNQWYIHKIQSFFIYQLKNLLKHYLNIMEMHLFQNLLLWIMLIKQNLSCCSVKIIEYSFAAINVMSSKRSVLPVPRMKVFSFYLLYAQMKMSSCLYQILLRFYQIHYYQTTENIRLHEIQFYIQIKNIIKISIFSQFKSNK